MKTRDLVSYLDTLLQTATVKDYCPNGLQIEGKQEINTIVTGVTACMALLEAAQQLNADAILVHHGYFWRGEQESITGMKQRRIKFLLQNDINLLAYHLPLDMHPELGNNAQFAKQMRFAIEQTVGEQGLIYIGHVPGQHTLESLGETMQARLGRVPLLIGNPKMEIRRVAWCTGAAQGYMEQALTYGIDAFISGEVAEQTVHLARESGVAYIAAGHHATERYGVQALGEHLAQQFGLQHHFVDIENPV